MQWGGLVILTPYEEKTEIVSKRHLLKPHFLSNVTFFVSNPLQNKSTEKLKIEDLFSNFAGQKIIRQRHQSTSREQATDGLTVHGLNMCCWQIVFSRMHPFDHHSYSMADKNDSRTFRKGHPMVSTTIVQVHAHACEYNITTFLCRWVRNQQDNPLPLNNIALLFIGRISGAHSNKSIP